MKNVIARFWGIVALLNFLGYGVEAKTSSFHSFSNEAIFVNSGNEKGDSIRMKSPKRRGTIVYAVNDTLDLHRLSRTPFVSLQQYLKGSMSGVYVQESTGEPGTLQNMLVRGISTPIFSKKDWASAQPVVYLNGIPLLVNDAFIYDIKSTDVNPAGTAMNILAGLNMDNVTSIEVVKDAARLAKLGPLAANGAILVNLKDGFYGGSNMFVRASGGMAIAPSQDKMTNAGNEYDFRMRFVDLCATDAQRTAYLNKMPKWMSDFRDYNFFGQSNWANEYYNKLASQYNFSASMGSGGSLANYIFMLGYTGNNGVADETWFNRLVASFALNMKLTDYLGVSTLINVARLSREGNRNLRDRYAEIEYLPDLTTPLSSTSYKSYLDSYKEFGRNDNLNNILEGYLAVNYSWRDLHLDTRIMMDYNTNVRHLFYPMDLMESVNYVSNFSGYNRRLIWNSTADYKMNIEHTHYLNFGLQAMIMKSVQHYNYAQAYDGTDDRKPSTNSGGYQYARRFLDKMKHNMVSTYFSADYRYKDIADVRLLIRGDGSSNVQKDSRWLFTPAVSVEFNFKNMFFFEKEEMSLSDLSLRASWARIGRNQDNNRIAAGPQYTGEELTSLGQPVTSSYYGWGTVARPYNTGWVGYGIGWPYSEKWNVGIVSSFFNNRFSLNVEYYNNTDCDLIVPIPVNSEFGYKYKYANGMKICNKGVELTLAGKPFSNGKKFSWDTSLSLAYNKNELVELPDNKDELVIGNMKLKKGNAVDQFWVYQNAGKYESDADVPVKDGKKLSMNSIEFSAGDPKWVDQNGDNLINSEDKILKGHSLPKVTGNFVNNFRFGRFDLGVNLYFALGHKAINYRSSQRYNFLSLENTPSLDNLHEIFFWQSTYDKNDYPMYNQMSGLTPYRAEQDLFLENLSFLKLRSVTLGYTMPLKKKVYKGGGKKKDISQNKLKDIHFYLTGTNLFTVTGFSGADPELVETDGYYRGYGQPLSPSVVVGLKLNF